MKKHKIVFLRGDLDDAGLGIISAMQANYFYSQGFDVTILLDKAYSKKLLTSSGAKLYNPNIKIIPCLTSKKCSHKIPKTKRKKIITKWFGGYRYDYYDEFGIFVKREYYDIDQRRVKIIIPIMEQYLTKLKKGDTIMVFQTSLMWYLANLNLSKSVSKIAQIHVQVFFTNKWIDNSNKHSALICLTKGTKNTYEQLYGKKNNIEIIPNPLRFNVPKKIIPHEKRKLKIIFVGLFIERKQPLHAIKAFIEIRKKHKNAILELYGKGELKNEIKEFIKKNNLQKCVIIKGFTNKISEIYSDASIMLFPTKSEAFGLVILEAMAYGVPTVMYSTTFGASELIDNKKDGYIVQQGNIQELSNKAIYLLNNYNIRNKFARMARKKIKKYQYNIIMPQWLNLIKKHSKIDDMVLYKNILNRLDIPNKLYKFILLNHYNKKDLKQIIDILRSAEAKIINGKPYIYSEKLMQYYNIPLDICQIT